MRTGARPPCSLILSHVTNSVTEAADATRPSPSVSRQFLRLEHGIPSHDSHTTTLAPPSGAPHGFVADYRPSYRKAATEDAWNKMTAWFKKYGVLS